jgi:hypothetical protein
MDPLADDETQVVEPNASAAAAPPVTLPVGEMFVPFKNKAALTGYYLAIFSLIPGLGLILGPFAFVLGIQGTCLATLNPQVRGGHHAAFSIVLGMITTIVNWVVLVMAAVFWFLLWPPPPAPPG